MRLCVVLLVAALGCLSQQTAGKPIGMEDTIADVVSRILEGSDKEKTEAITLVLQLLTEIDLPSLCKSIGDDPTKMTSVDDIVARAATARHTEATTAPVMVSDTDVDLAEQNNTNMNWKTDSSSTLDVAEKEFTSTDEALEETKDDVTEAASKEVELNAEVEVFQEISLTATVQAPTETEISTVEPPTETNLTTTKAPTEAKITSAELRETNLTAIEEFTEVEVTTVDQPTEAETTTIEVATDAKVTTAEQPTEKEITTMEAKGTTVEQPAENEITTIEVATEAKVTTVNPHTEKEITTMEAKVTTVEQPTENEITTIEVATEAKVTTVDPHTEKEITAMEVATEAKVTTVEPPTEEAITTTTEVAPETEISTITESFTEGNLATKDAHTDVLFETKEQTATEDILPTETHNPATSMPSESSLSYDAWNVDDSTDYIARIKSLYDDYLHVPDYTSSRLLPPNPGYDYFDLTDNLIYDIAAAAETSKTDVLHRLEQALQNGNEEMLHFPDSILTLNSLASQLKPEDDIVYIEESKSLKPKPVLSSENFQREEGLPLDSQMVLQEPKQLTSSEHLMTPLSPDAQVSHVTTNFVDDIVRSDIKIDVSDVITEAPLTSESSSQSSVVLLNKSEDILGDTEVSFITNLTESSAGEKEMVYIVDSSTKPTTNLSSSGLSTPTNGTNISPEELSGASNLEENTTRYEEIFVTSVKQLETREATQSDTLNTTNRYADAEPEIQVNVSKDDEFQERRPTVTEVFPWLGIIPDFHNSTNNDFLGESQPSSLAPSHLAPSLNKTASIEINSENSFASSTSFPPEPILTEDSSILNSSAGDTEEKISTVTTSTLLSSTTETDISFNYTPNVLTTQDSNATFNTEDTNGTDHNLENGSISSEKISLTTPVSAEFEGNDTISEAVLLREEFEKTSTTEQTTSSTSQTSPVTKASSQTSAEGSTWTSETPTQENKRRSPMLSLSRTLEQHLGHVNGGNLKRMPENSISSDVFSHWSGQEVDDKWSVIGKKRDGILENEAAIPAAKDRDDENRYVEYKLDSTPFEGNKVWSSLTDARTYEPRWDIRHNVKESDVSGTEHRSLTTPEASTTAKYIVDPSNAIQDTQRVKSATFPPVVRDYSPRTWSPFNPHFASPNLGSLWGLNPNFQHNTHHFAPEKFNDMGSYPEFQFGRPSPWKPSDISYHVKNAKPKVSSEVLKTLGIKQKTILSEETLPKFLHFNGYLCPGLFGYFGDVMDCRSFFICSWGVPYRFYCPSGTLWNPMESVCDWSRNVKCSKK